jgi:hypothetical protein
VNALGRWKSQSRPLNQEDHEQIQANLAAERARHLPPRLMVDPTEADRQRHAAAAECERRQRLAELEAGRLGLSFTLIPPKPFPYLATPTSTPREKPAVTAAAVLAPVPPAALELPDVPGVKAEKVREVWVAAHKVAAAGKVVTSSAISDHGPTLAVVFKVQTGLRKAGVWPWPAARHGRPPTTRRATGEWHAKAPPKPPSVRREPRPTPTLPVSPPDAPERVLEPPGGLPEHVEIVAPSYYVTPDGLEWGDCWSQFRGRDAAVESALAQIGQYAVRCGRKPNVPAIEDARKIVKWGEMLVRLLEAGEVAS